MLNTFLNPFSTWGYSTNKITYTPLLTGLKEIRLLELTSTKTARIVHVPLDSAPAFYALSYAWGDPTPTAAYTVGDKKILVAKSLSGALARVFNFLRAWSRSWPYVWADAICINQSDNEEKAAQVALMGDIYKHAKQVLIYLGEDGFWQDSGPVVHTIQAWGNWYRDYKDVRLDDDDYHGEYISPYAKYYAPQHERRSKYERLKREHFQKLPSLSGTVALELFFKRPWWNRVWTLQELLFARSAIVICGKHHVEWETVKKAVQLWRDAEALRDYLPYEDGELVARILANGLGAKTALQRRWGQTLSWLSILVSTTNFASTDARDRIYAIAGIAPAIDDFKISYTDSAAEVYKNFTQKVFLDTGNLEILQLAGVNHDEARNPYNIPSWIPNFADLDHPMLLYYKKLHNQHYSTHVYRNFKIWNASASIPASLSPPTTTSAFRPKGVRIGSITRVRDPIRNTGWIGFMHTHLGLEYNTPTLKCHILQAYFRTILSDRLETTNKKLSESDDRFEVAGSFWRWIRPVYAGFLADMGVSGRIDELLLGEASPKQIPGISGPKPFRVEAGTHYLEMLRSAYEKFDNLHFFILDNEYIGYGVECQPRDIVAIIFGCSVPLIMRPLRPAGSLGEGGSGDGQYRILGQCFVLGVMEGELFKDAGEESVVDVDGIEEVEGFDIV